MTSSGGAVIQPIFQPVVLKVLPPDEMVTVRSRRTRQGGDRHVRRLEHQVLVDLVGHDDGVVAVGELDDQLERLGREARIPSGCAAC